MVHQLPQRIRLRPCAGRWTARQRDRLAAALRDVQGIEGFRVSEHSLTVHHSMQPESVIGCVRRALMEPCLPAPTHVEVVPVLRTEVALHVDDRHRHASRRLLVCAVAGLAIALLPEPVAPAMIALRLLACAAMSAVQHHDEALIVPCRLTRLLNTIADLIGLRRAENLIRALLKQFLVASLKNWAKSTSLRPALA